MTLYCSTYHVQHLVCSDTAPVSRGYIVATTVLGILAFSLLGTLILAVTIGNENDRTSKQWEKAYWVSKDSLKTLTSRCAELRRERDAVMRRESTVTIRDVLRRRARRQLKRLSKRLNDPPIIIKDYR